MGNAHITRMHQKPGKEQAANKNNKAYKVRPWAIDISHSWINCFSKLPVRFEKLKGLYKGLLMFACAFIAFRKANRI
jgi:hypothetical protein